MVRLIFSISAELAIASDIEGENLVAAENVTLRSVISACRDPNAPLSASDALGTIISVSLAAFSNALAPTFVAAVACIAHSTLGLTSLNASVSIDCKYGNTRSIGPDPSGTLSSFFLSSTYSAAVGIPESLIVQVVPLGRSVPAKSASIHCFPPAR